MTTNHAADRIRQPSTLPTVPHVGDLELEAHSSWLHNIHSWELDCTDIGMSLAPNTHLDIDLAGTIAGEPAAAAAEFAGTQFPDAEVSVIPVSDGSHANTAALAGLAKVTGQLGLRPFEPGGGVIVPALTWPATAIAVLRRNLVPVQTDMHADTLALDIDEVRRAITDRTVAIFAVHLYGHPRFLQDFGTAITRLHDAAAAGIR